MVLEIFGESFTSKLEGKFPCLEPFLQPNFKGNSLVWGAKPSKYCPIVLMGRQTFQVLPNCPEIGRQTFQVLPNCLEMGRQTFQVRLIIRHNLSKLFFPAQIIRAWFWGTPFERHHYTFAPGRPNDLNKTAECEFKLRKFSFDSGWQR